MIRSGFRGAAILEIYSLPRTSTDVECQSICSFLVLVNVKSSRSSATWSRTVADVGVDQVLHSSAATYDDS